MSKLICESDAQVPILRAKLDHFYRDFSDYNAFRSPSNVAHFWPLLIPAIDAVCRRRETCRILEFGAGRTGFARTLLDHGLRKKVNFTTHDITDKNRLWLEQEADAICIGGVPAITGEYDVIFSTFVLEHMTDPQESLSHLWTLLASGGTLVVTCPRYDLPFYLPPSCDHLKFMDRLALAVKLLGWRTRTLLTGTPAFRLLDDLAMFHLPWAQDRDAVHLVSYYDLRAFFRRRGGRVKRGRNIFGGTIRDLLSWGGVKDWIVKRYLTVCLQADRN